MMKLWSEGVYLFLCCVAAVSRKAGEPLVMEEVMVAPPMAGEVRIRIICTSLCHSDLTFWKLKVVFSLPLPLHDFWYGYWTKKINLEVCSLCRNLQHAFREFWVMKPSGNLKFVPLEPGGFLERFRSVGCDYDMMTVKCRVVESVGENVTEVAEGDTVLPIFIPDCGECMDCRSEKSNLCSKFPFEISPWLPRHKSSRFTDLKGEVLYHFLNVSSFSEYTVVDIDNITKISPAIPPNKACLFSCGVSTGINMLGFRLNSLDACHYATWSM